MTLDNVGPLAGSGITKALPRTSLRDVDPNMPIAYASSWNLSLERQLQPNTVVSPNYTGSRGIHVYCIENINVAGFGNVYGGIASSNLVRLNDQYTSINFRGSNGDSWYHGMVASFRTSNIRTRA